MLMLLATLSILIPKCPHPPPRSAPPLLTPSPLLSSGAVVGRLYGEVVHLVGGHGYSRDELPTAIFAVVGAAALTAGATQTLSTALITLELTNQQKLLNPVRSVRTSEQCLAALLTLPVSIASPAPPHRLPTASPPPP